MQKFYNNTPDNYLHILQKEMSENDKEVPSGGSHSVQLGSGELRSEYLNELRIESDRYRAQQEEQLVKDKELALQLEAEAAEKLSKLQELERNDQKIALALVSSERGRAHPAPPPKKNSIVMLLQKQSSAVLEQARDVSSRLVAAAAASNSTTSASSPALTDTSHTSSGSVFLRDDEELSGDISVDGLRDENACANTTSSSSSSARRLCTTSHYGTTPAGTEKAHHSVSLQSHNISTASISAHRQPSPDGVAAAAQGQSAGGGDDTATDDELTPPLIPGKRPTPRSGSSSGFDSLEKRRKLIHISGNSNSGRVRTSAAVEDRTAVEGDWPCRTCTFVNSRYLARCEMCDRDRTAT